MGQFSAHSERSTGGHRADGLRVGCWKAVVCTAVLVVLACTSQAQRVLSPVHEKSAQSPLETESPLTVNVRLVLVPVTVLGAPDHRFTAGDFEVFDDGHKQHVAVFDSDFSSPISLVVAIDTSLSTATHLEQEKNAALEIINAVGPQDALELVNFNHIVAAETSFTNDRAVLAHAVHALRPSGATSLYDAIYLASDELGRRTGRKALIIISDGGDTTSSVTFQRALREAIGADVVIYSVVVVPIESDAGRDIGGEHALQYLSEQTGGQTFAADPAHLSQPVERVLGALRREYLIGFYPKLNSKDDSAGVHQIRVETKYTGLTLLSRKRYYED